MKKKMLGLALLGAVCMSQVAAAQEFDNRWYIQGTVGLFMGDDDRIVNNEALYGIGVGKRLTPNIGLELTYDYTAPVLENFINGYPFPQGDYTWSLSTIWVNGRYYFVKEGRNWDPYILGGIGATSHDDETNYFNGSNSRDGTEFAAQLGLGIETDRRKRVDFRVEAGVRYDGDSFDYTLPRVGTTPAVTLSNGSFTDYFVSASLLVKLGDLPVPVVAPTCDTLDSDNDGVNDCNDKCPGSTAGQTIGADGCPVKLTIDLKGVNFDFDKDTLRPDSIVILDEAVAVLAKYPELKVGVDGHTDQCGDDKYNQELSQRRAAVVFQYLVDKGITTDRLAGPTGFGESNPLVDSGQAYPGCKNETNRRTELNVQN
ncbi:MAG: OmpA family protein [Arenimonas sp.]|nr:OmpA family protein [Arenimonas sp.]MBP6310561.1 OmpA family protein [Arenimonas sp.]